MKLNDITKIGIVGGGVSALMMCIEAMKLGMTTTLLDPKLDCVGAQVATEHILGVVNNENIEKLSLRVDVIVFNHKLDFPLECKLHCKTYPSKSAMNEMSNPKGMLELLEILEIPMPRVYYQDNKQMAFEKIEELSLPFNFIKQIGSRSELEYIATHDDMADAILGMDEGVEAFAIQTIPSYARHLVSLVIVDENGKAQIYDPLEVSYENDTVSSMEVAANLTKTTVQKIARFNRKLIKELEGAGVYTIKYGMKANKAIELVDITANIDMSALLTIEAHDMSIYEQYMHLIIGMPVMAPTLESLAQGTIKEINKVEEKNKPYYMYNLGLTNLCITKNRIEK